jgi:hypothetical protein
LVSYRSVLADPFVYVPHEALPIRIFAAADLPDLWARAKPVVRLEGCVDGHNQRVPQATLDALFPKSVAKYVEYSDAKALATWLVAQLKK